MFVKVNGHLVHTVSFGAGATTLLGLGGWVADWELWEQPFELLSGRWRCVSYDHRGAGETVVPLEAITPDGLVDDVFGVMDALGIDRCILAGESLGSVVALEAALRAPERFRGLVLVDGAPAVTKLVQPLIDGTKESWETMLSTFVELCTPEPEAAPLRRWGCDMLRRADAAAAVRIFESYLERKGPRLPLAEVRVPTLVIHGTEDAIVPLSVGEHMAATIPGASLVKLEGAGHTPTVTRPREVVDAILAWSAALG